MKDAEVIAILVAGLLLQGAAVGVGFTPLGWRWPLLGAAAAIALGILIARGTGALRGDALDSALIAFAALTLAAAAWHAASPAPAAAWTLRVCFGIEALGLSALLIFLLTFRMTRLF